MTMLVKNIIDEDFVNYKKPSMFIAFPSCDWKCERDCGERVCQNHPLAKAKSINVRIDEIVERYTTNSITSAIVCGGLEPFDSFISLLELVIRLRTNGIHDDIVIYTGYYPHEIEEEEKKLAKFGNIVIKYGRFVPNNTPKYDSVLGVTLSSENQYAVRH